MLKQFAPDGAAAKTKAKMPALIAETIAFHIEGLKEFGENAPRLSFLVRAKKVNFLPQNQILVIQSPYV